MKRIGLVNIDTSHPIAWAKKMDTEELDMQYAMLYNDGFRKENEENWFIEKYNMLPKVTVIKELAKKCDIGFVQSCNWDKHIDQALPFIEEGKPVFIDKPMVGNVKDTKKIRELVKNGATIIGCSSARYAEEVQEFLALPLEERGEVVSVYVETGVDEFNYGVHAGEILSEIAGAKAVSCRYIGRAERCGTECDTYYVTFENGVRGTYVTYLSGWRKFNVSIITTKSSYCFTVNSGKIYMALLSRISKYLETGEQTTADIEKILNVTEFMLCGKRSRDVENGKEVYISELTDEDAFDGNAFEKAYGDAATEMYKDS